MIGVIKMKKFFIKKDAVTNETVLGYLGYDINTEKDIEYVVYDRDGKPFNRADDFLVNYLKNKDFVNKYSEVKLRHPKDKWGARKNVQEDYYDFIPQKQNHPEQEAKRFILVVDRDIKDYAVITSEIADVALTLEMNQKKEILSKKIKNICVSAASVALISSIMFAGTYGVFYASNGYENPKQVFTDVCHTFGNVGTIVIDGMKGKSYEEIKEHINERNNNSENTENNSKTR